MYRMLYLQSTALVIYCAICTDISLKRKMRSNIPYGLSVRLYMYMQINYLGICYVLLYFAISDSCRFSFF